MPRKSARIARVVDAEDRPQLVINVTQSWLNYDPKGAERWVLGLSHSDERDAGLVTILQSAQYMEDPHIRRLLDRVYAEEQRNRAVNSLINNLSRSDPARAESWLDSSYVNESQRVRFQQIIDRRSGRQ